MYKRILAAAVLLCLLAAAAGCGTNVIGSVDSASVADVAGTWQLDAVKLNGVTYVDTEYLDDYDYSFTFTEDGSAVARVLGINYTTTYEIRDGWVIFADADLAAVKLKVFGDTLELDVNLIGGGLVFKRTE